MDGSRWKTVIETRVGEDSLTCGRCLCPIRSSKPVLSVAFHVPGSYDPSANHDGNGQDETDNDQHPNRTVPSSLPAGFEHMMSVSVGIDGPSLDYDDLLAEVCRQIETHGLKLKQAEAAIIDATLIASDARPRGHIEGVAEDRAEDEATTEPPDVSHSADPDATWVRKGRKSTLGYNGFARTDEEGFVDKVHVTPANKGESPEFDTMIEGASAQRVLAEKAYASRANREALKGKHRDGIMRKAAQGHPLRQSEKRFNKLISKRRFRVEQCFGTMKRLFELARARYFGRAKAHAQMAMAAIAQNLLKAANKITLTNQTPAIA